MDERNDYASECPNFDDVRAVVSRALVWAIIVVFASVVVASWCLGAPAPKPRPKPAPKAVTVERLAPHHLVGTWTMSWRGTDYATTLDAGGGYRAVGPGGTEWLGPRRRGRAESDGGRPLRQRQHGRGVDVGRPVEAGRPQPDRPGRPERGD